MTTEAELSAPVGRRRAELAGGKKPQAVSAPHAGQPVDRPGAARIVNAQPFQQIGAPDHHDTGHGADHDRAKS